MLIVDMLSLLIMPKIVFYLILMNNSLVRHITLFQKMLVCLVLLTLLGMHQQWKLMPMEKKWLVKELTMWRRCYCSTDVEFVIGRLMTRKESS